MAESDVNARFNTMSVTSGSLAQVAIEAIRTAALDISDRASEGEHLRVTAVFQHLERAAHAAARLLNEVEAMEPPDRGEPAEEDQGERIP